MSLAGAFDRAGIKQSAAHRAHAVRETELGALNIPTRVLPFSKPGPFHHLARHRQDGDGAQRARHHRLDEPRRQPDAGQHRPAPRLEAHRPLGRLLQIEELSRLRRARWQHTRHCRLDHPRRLAQQYITLPNFARPPSGLIVRETLDTPPDVPLLNCMDDFIPARPTGRSHCARCSNCLTLTSGSRATGRTRRS